MNISILSGDDSWLVVRVVRKLAGYGYDVEWKQSSENLKKCLLEVEH